MAKVLFGAVIYFGLVFAVGFAFGPIRELVIEPMVGPFIATLIEAPILFTAIVLAARHSPRWAHMPKQLATMALMGGLALCLQQIADYAVGLLLRGMSYDQQIEQYQTPEGWIYLGLLVAFTVMPMALHAWKIRETARAHGWTIRMS